VERTLYSLCDRSLTNFVHYGTKRYRALGSCVFSTVPGLSLFQHIRLALLLHFPVRSFLHALLAGVSWVYNGADRGLHIAT
jgi:hypothetical protein